MSHSFLYKRSGTSRASRSYTDVIVSDSRPPRESLSAGGPGSTGIVPAKQLSHYLKALRRRWWVIAIVTVLAAGAAVAVSLHTQKRYDATAQVLVTNSEPINALFLTSSNRSQDPERDINTDVALVTTQPVAEKAIRQLGLHSSP